jgi:hypothetical protein
MHETIANGSLVLLVATFVLEQVVGMRGFEPINLLFDHGFPAALFLFLLVMWPIATRRFIKRASDGMARPFSNTIELSDSPYRLLLPIDHVQNVYGERFKCPNS